MYNTFHRTIDYIPIQRYPSQEFFATCSHVAAIMLLWSDSEYHFHMKLFALSSFDWALFVRATDELKMIQRSCYTKDIFLVSIIRQQPKIIAKHYTYTGIVHTPIYIHSTPYSRAYYTQDPESHEYIAAVKYIHEGERGSRRAARNSRSSLACSLQRWPGRQLDFREGSRARAPLRIFCDPCEPAKIFFFMFYA